MRKKDKSIMHYIVMGLLCIFPLLMVGISALSPHENEEVQVNYKYETNEVNSVDDIISGNVYLFEMPFTSIDSYVFAPSRSYFYLDTIELFDYDFRNHEGIFVDDYYSSMDISSDIVLRFYVDEDFQLYEQLISLDFGDYLISLVFEPFLDSMEFSFSGVFRIVYESNPFIDEVVDYISACPLEYIPIESVEVIKDESVATTMLGWCDTFVNLPINTWYKSLLDIIGLGYPNNIMSIIYIYPLYLIWVIIFDLVYDFLVFIPKLAHKWLEKGFEE